MVRNLEGWYKFGRVAHFQSIANYGRLTSAHVCGGPIRTTNCGGVWALCKVRGDCQGRPGCTLIANNNKFGDPCPSAYK